MRKYFQNKKILAAGTVILVLILVGGGFLVLSNRNKPANFSNPSDQSAGEAPVATLTAKDIGLVVTVRSDDHAMMFKINNASDIQHVDYQITYDHLVDGNTVSEGITGEMNIAQDGITKTDWRNFGTCSATCRYDVGVSNVQLIMKILKKDGKLYSLQQAVPLNNTGSTSGSSSSTSTVNQDQ